MTSCEDAPCDNRGYNVCIENATDVDVLFEFNYATLPIGSGALVQSVTVKARDSICYRINIPPGAILRVRIRANNTYSALGVVHISGPTHLRAFAAGNGDVALSSDCSPCPVSCDRACNKKPSPCKPCA